MNTTTIEMGTDSGPACTCGGTIYLYAVRARACTRVNATCSTCRAASEFVAGHKLTTVQEVREAHAENVRIAAWTARQAAYCVGAGFIRRGGDALLQVCIGPRPGYAAGYFCGGEILSMAELTEWMGDRTVEWTEDFAGKSFRVYSATPRAEVVN